MLPAHIGRETDKHTDRQTDGRQYAVRSRIRDRIITVHGHKLNELIAISDGNFIYLFDAAALMLLLLLTTMML